MPFRLRDCRGSIAKRWPNPSAITWVMHPAVPALVAPEELHGIQKFKSKYAREPSLLLGGPTEHAHAA